MNLKSTIFAKRLISCLFRCACVFSNWICMQSADLQTDVHPCIRVERKRRTHNFLWKFFPTGKIFDKISCCFGVHIRFDWTTKSHWDAESETNQMRNYIQPFACQKILYFCVISRHWHSHFASMDETGYFGIVEFRFSMGVSYPIFCNLHEATYINLNFRSKHE